MISSRRRTELASALNHLYRQTDFAARISQDPIIFPRRFSQPADIEIAGWLAASLAYGRVPLFQGALNKILHAMQGKPYEYVVRFNPARDLAAFAPLYYRMNTGKDIACLIYLIQQVFQRHGSVEGLFLKCYRRDEPHTGPALERFIRELEAIDTAPIYGKNIRPRGLSQFFSLPSKGSACKRLNLFLRWMIRPDDGLDFGLWDKIPPSRLIVPLDTHVLRISRYLGLTRRRTAGWTTALEITNALRSIDQRDPLKYDFPLCHLGISGNCPSVSSPAKCAACPLLNVCARGQALRRTAALVAA